ncbi:hypothetical protein KIW84_042606 [Lathyrus oleraceus]|uniref:Choline transporter-like protein n=1 Tax=Pisum sativum TaxID=3888 RepID=A0A9D5AMW4_PEA|nr:hypothetical protein KIW84_042606 [Pisum sativum]
MEKRVICDRCCGYSIHYTPHIGVAILFHLFGCYWVTQFLIACSSTVIAGSVASYYWGRGEASPEIPFISVFSSMKRLIRYSLGSLALGSLIVSFVESIRFLLESIRCQLKVSSHAPDNWFLFASLVIIAIVNSTTRRSWFSIRKLSTLSAMFVIRSFQLLVVCPFTFSRSTRKTSPRCQMQNLVERVQMLKYMECKGFHQMYWLLIMKMTMFHQ